MKPSLFGTIAGVWLLAVGALAIMIILITGMVVTDVTDSDAKAVRNGESLGTVTDFVVAGNGDYCTVEFDTGEKHSLSTACGELQTGVEVYRHDSYLLFGEHHHVIEGERQ